MGYTPGLKAKADVTRDAEALRKAMKGFGTDEAALIKILSEPDPLQMANLVDTYTTHLGRELRKDVKSEVSGDLERVLLALIDGPLGQDVVTVNEALAGLGTKEDLLNEVLIGRSNADMKAIKTAYQQKYGKSLESAVSGDLSSDEDRLFKIILKAARQEEATFIDPAAIDKDVREIHEATEARTGTDEVAVSAILATRSDNQLRAIIQAYPHRYHASLDDVIKKEFSGHIRDALRMMVGRANNPARYDADLLHQRLSSSPDNRRLIYRLIHIHWDKMHLQNVKKAYQDAHGMALRARIQRTVKDKDLLEALSGVCGF